MANAMPKWKEWISGNQEARQWNGVSLLMTLPLLVMGYVYYGGQALRLAVISALAAVACELVAGLIILRRRSLDDFNALLIGFWIACMLPAQISPWFGVAGAMFAVLAVKIPFGGTMSAPFVPAAAGFAFLTVCFPEVVFSYAPSALAEPIHSSSLAALLRQGQSVMQGQQLSAILQGQTVGPMGTGSIIVLAAVFAASFLIKQRRKAALSSLGFVVTVALLAFLLHRSFGSRWGSVGMELCSGSLLFAGVFLLPDPATMPERWYTRLLYGVMAGCVTMLLRILGSYEENVCFAVLLANAILPLIIRARDEMGQLSEFKARLARKKEELRS
ncbi:MAG: RnfABCDGE type electron transport complex subunit D [Oscillospiraceae bacterium]|nr:RnfABCDGE type electron transport complex subunit D [Oscillospiraceae bacterium]